jgi:hypothetical protein
MVPLVGDVTELRLVRAEVEGVLAAVAVRYHPGGHIQIRDTRPGAYGCGSHEDVLEDLHAPCPTGGEAGAFVPFPQRGVHRSQRQSAQPRTSRRGSR